MATKVSLRSMTAEDLRAKIARIDGTLAGSRFRCERQACVRELARRERIAEKNQVKISYSVEIDRFTLEVLDGYAEELGYPGKHMERVSRLLSEKGREIIEYAMETRTCHQCGAALGRFDEGIGTSRGECRKCIEKEDV